MDFDDMSDEDILLADFNEACFGLFSEKSVSKVLADGSKHFNGPADGKFFYKMVMNAAVSKCLEHPEQDRILDHVMKFMKSHLQPITWLDSVEKNDLMKHIIMAFLEDNLDVAESLLVNAAKFGLLNYLPPAVYCSIFGSEANVRKEMWMLLSKHVSKSTINNPENRILGVFMNNFVHTAEDVEFAEMMINFGVSVDEDHEDGFDSPLMRSIRLNKTSLVSLIIDKGAKVNSLVTDGEAVAFPLHYSIRYNNKDTVNLLVSSGADIDAKNLDDGITALHIACLENRNIIIDALIRKGANISAEDDYGKTPFSLLQLEKHFYNECVVVFVKEFARLSFENRPISSVDMELIKANSRDREHFENCVKELSLMAATEFNAPHSFYSVLNKVISVKKLAPLTNNEELVFNFESNLPKFTYYQNDLKLIWKEAVRIRDEFETVVLRLTLIFGKILIEDIIRLLAKNFTAEDLPLE